MVRAKITYFVNRNGVTFWLTVEERRRLELGDRGTGTIFMGGTYSLDELNEEQKRSVSALLTTLIDREHDPVFEEFSG